MKRPTYIPLLFVLASPQIAYAAWPDEQPYYLFWANRGCSGSPTYVVRPQPTRPDGVRQGEVVEVLHGPPRSQIELGPRSSQLEGDLIVVYTDANGVAKEVFPFPFCFPHPEEHPRTTWIRAWNRYDSDPSASTVLELLASPELPEASVGCAVADGGELSGLVGSYLAFNLGRGGKLQRQLDVGEEAVNLLQGFLDKSQDFRAYVAYTAYCRCVDALTMHLEGGRRSMTPEWRRQGLRVLLELSEDPDESLRRLACRELSSTGFDVGCAPEGAGKPQRFADKTKLWQWRRVLDDSQPK